MQLLYANEPKSVDALPVGSVGVVLGLKHTRTGDTLISANAANTPGADALRDIKPPPAVISAAVIPQSYADLKPVQEALLNLQRTDPSVRIEPDKEGQLLVHGLGALHLEIVEGRLREEFGVQFEFGARRVGYREGFPGAARIIDDVWEFASDGRQMQVNLRFAVQPLKVGDDGDPSWDGNVVLDAEGKPLLSPETSAGVDPALHALAQGIQSFLSNSLNSSLPYCGVQLQVIRWDLPRDNVPTSLLTHACTAILRNDFRHAGMGDILEPYVRVKVDVTEDLMGTVIRDLTENNGQIQDLRDDGSAALDLDEGDGDVGPYLTDGLYVPPDWLTPCSATSAARDIKSPQNKRTIHAIAPLSKMLDYLIRLRALSGGRGEYDMVNIGFYATNALRREEILREIGKM